MKIFRISIYLLSFGACLASLPTKLHASNSIGVAPLQYHGPAADRYLADAAQDSLMGILTQKGYEVRALPKAMDPASLQAIKGSDLLWIVGSLNAVGSNIRLRMKWLNAQGKSEESYLSPKDFNDLIPQLEALAQNKIVGFLGNTAAQPSIATAPTKVVEAPATPPTPEPPQKVKAEKPSPYPPLSSAKPKTKSQKLEEASAALREYQISERLPFEVRSMAYADLDGDHTSELIFTDKDKIYIYHFNQEKLELTYTYSGKKWDYFVKIDTFQGADGKTYLALTNLRGDQALSKILAFTQGQLVAVQENIPYLLRTVALESQVRLLATPYIQETGFFGKIFLLDFKNNKISLQEKLELPQDTALYNFVWLNPEKGKTSDLVSLSPLGKVRLFTWNGSRYEKKLVSRESYGGTGNFVPVEVKDFFNEVVSNYYGVSAGMLLVQTPTGPAVAVVRQTSFMKDIVGRIPMISSGELVLLKWDTMGFIESWVSKKVDGSIQDYLVTNLQEKDQILAAVRLRNPGLLGEVGKNDSVLLRYDLK